MLLALLVAVPLTLRAQNYNVNDTVTEYHVKGTYYHDKFEGRKTACGEIFDQNLFTAAHWKIKMGTYVLVTNKNTGLQVIVKVNDRCPKRGVIDMSKRAARSIGIKGCQPVTMRILPEGYEAMCEAQDALFDSVSSRLSPHTETEKETSSSAQTLEQKYNLAIGTVENHGQAFELISRLPKKYQEKAIINTIEDNILTIILEVGLPKKKAEQLRLELKYKFKECQVIPKE